MTSAFHKHYSDTDVEYHQQKTVTSVWCTTERQVNFGLKLHQSRQKISIFVFHVNSYPSKVFGIVQRNAIYGTKLTNVNIHSEEIHVLGSQPLWPMAQKTCHQTEHESRNIFWKTVLASIGSVLLLRHHPSSSWIRWTKRNAALLPLTNTTIVRDEMYACLKLYKGPVCLQVSSNASRSFIQSVAHLEVPNGTNKAHSSDALPTAARDVCYELAKICGKLLLSFCITLRNIFCSLTLECYPFP